MRGAIFLRIADLDIGIWYEWPAWFPFDIYSLLVKDFELVDLYLFKDCRLFVYDVHPVFSPQGTKKFRSDSPGLVDFVIALVEFILHLPDRQVKVFRDIFSLKLINSSTVKHQQFSGW